ncbi:MAG: pyruvate dehydrogenase (acetyl-transferring) E1 component subunit alpha [Alphaproteobacteria bacterium]|nr:pyruvate dehydrogenase (acetyl-transferring) E1 component subunit alpha [Rickettsiales bacterium]
MSSVKKNPSNKKTVSGDNSLNNSMLIDCYKEMVRIRIFEENIARCYREGLISGFCHLYIGQEAIATGFHFASVEGDSFITSYRCHSFGLMRGISMASLFAELFGRSSGSSKGKGGSMHIFHPEGGFFGGHGIVGAQVSIGTGLAMANKQKSKQNVCFVFLGDGALNQGQVYESFNLAKVFSLPVVYVIENNIYAMGTSVNRSSANSENLHQRCIGFGIKGIKIDGMNLLETYNTAQYARDYALQNGPILINAVTYRYHGHSMSDPAKYRSKKEVDDVKNNRDPINGLMSYILSNKLETKGNLNAIEQDVIKETELAKTLASSAPEPDLQELYTNVY